MREDERREMGGGDDREVERESDGEGGEGE